MPSSLFIINNIPSAQHLHVAVQLSKGSRQPLSCLLNHCIHSVLLVVRRGAGVSAQLVRLRGSGATSTTRESDRGSAIKAARILGHVPALLQGSSRSGSATCWCAAASPRVVAPQIAGSHQSDAGGTLICERGSAVQTGTSW